MQTDTRALSRRLLVAFLLVGLAPTLGSLTMVYFGSRTVVERLLSESIGRTARMHAAGIDDFLTERRAVLGAFARSLPPATDALARAVGESPTVGALLFLDAGGAVLASSGPSSWAERACRDLARDPSGARTEPGRDHADEVVIAVPRGQGIACALVSFSLHQAAMSDRSRTLVQGTAYIVDRAGEVVCHEVDEHVDHHHRGSVLVGEAGARARDGQPWAGVYAGPEGRHLGAFAAASGVPWGVWVEVPAHVAVEATRPLLVRSLCVGAGVVLVLVLVSVVLVQRLVRDTVSELDERVRARTVQLRSATELTDLLLDAVEQRILLIDRAGVIIRANDAALATYGPDIVGSPCEDVHGGGAAGPCSARQVLEHGRPLSGERVREEAGAKRILAVDIYPVDGSDGTPRAAVEVARDVTDLKQFQAQLLHQEKMSAVGTLSAGLAHEIGNPLASMSSELEMLERAWDPDDARASLPVLRTQIDRIARLLRELVDFGRRGPDRPELQSAAEVVGDALRLLRHDPRARGVELSTELDPYAPPVHASRDRLVQVLVNLGLNALDAAAGSGQVVFAVARCAEDEVEIVVRDSGPGVPVELRDKVFEPFFTTKPPGRGTGLGLFVSERVVAGLGGRMEMGHAPEGGAAVRVMLPTEPTAEGDTDA